MRFCGNCGTRLIEGDRSPDISTDSQPFLAEKLGVLVGSDLIDRFQKAGLEAQGQRRNVTVLFADLSDYTGLSARIDGEDLFIIVQQLIQSLAKVVYKYEGMVDKIIGDGLMALFGAPIAYENNAERAVRAALEIQNEVASLSEKLVSQLGVDIKVHIGLHSGTVIVGGVGSNALMDYTAIGDTVNLAHRLEEAASAGTTLVSESVYQQTRMLFDYESIPALNLKGIHRPVQGYRLVGIKIKPGSVRGIEGLKSPLVGRESELEFLEQTVQRLSSRGQGNFVLLVGEAGIGKSRLTAELKESIRQFPVNVIEGQSLTYRRSVSYWIIQDLLRNYLDISSDMSPSMARERLVTKVKEVLGTRSAAVLPFLEHLLSLSHSETIGGTRLAYLDASQLRQQIFLSVRDLILAEARLRPLVLIFEDLHWADDASLDLLGFLMESVRNEPLLIYAISRPIDKGKVAEISEQGRANLGDLFTVLPLEALSLQQSERLFEQLLSIPEIPSELIGKVLQQAAGIPFYLEEILRMLIDAQVIQRVGDRWHLVPETDISSVGVPDTLRDLILTRFDRLDTYHRNILQAASVIGRKFNLSVLDAVITSTNREGLERILEDLIQRDFIQLLNSDSVPEYTFRHVLTSDAVYSTLLKRDRGELHRRVAETIESLYKDQVDNYVEVLAGHYSLSIQLDRALHFLILSGQKAAREYANEQALRHFKDALNLLSRVEHSIEQSLQIHLGLGDVLLFVGDYLPAREQFQAALDTIGSSESDHFLKERGLLHRKIATTLERQGDYEQALSHYATSSDLLECEPDIMPVEQAQLLNDIGWIHFLRGNFEEAQRNLTRALKWVEQSNQYNVIASIHNRLGAVAYHQRDYEKSAAHVRKSLVLRETIGDLAGVARLYNNLGLLGLIRGDLRDAEANFLQAIELLERIGDAEGIALAYTNLGLVRFDRGYFESAQQNLERSLKAAEHIGHRFYRGRALMYLGRLKTAQGFYDQSDDLLQESITILEGLNAQDNLVDAIYYMGENCFSHGDLDGALKWLSKADELIASGDENLALSVQRGRLLRLQGSIARSKGNYKDANDLLVESSAIFQTSDERLEAAKTILEFGYLARVQNNSLKARQHFQEARLLFNQFGADHNLQKTEKALQNLS
jgi:class 3 adenylate cyclase/tetratricopeptide (TPR) repeat protein